VSEPPGDRRSRILGGAWQGEGRRAVLVALISTVVFFAALGFGVTHAPGWPALKEAFFNGKRFLDAFPEALRGFRVNVELFLVAEVVVLVFALFIAVLRSLPGPVFFPIRLLAIAYTDFFRGVPTILFILLLGFGAPTLGAGVPTSTFFWAVVALVLVYSAYVAEVYRAGIESIHPSQVAAARSLGLSRWQSLRFVVLPQAIRRVVPPLLNDFIGLQKDTALVSVIGTVESLRAAEIQSSATFNFTSYLATALLFVVITIPMARLTDWLIAREQRRRQAGTML
jgi:polar amino acid transport system permease protein